MIRLSQSECAACAIMVEKTVTTTMRSALTAGLMPSRLRSFGSRCHTARRERARTYTQLLEASGLTCTGKITLLKTLPHAHHIHHQYVVRAQKRDQLRVFLAEHGVGTEIYYPLPLHLQKCFAWLGYAQGDLPEAELAAAEVLALPMFAELREEEQQYVVDCLADFYS